MVNRIRVPSECASPHQYQTERERREHLRDVSLHRGLAPSPSTQIIGCFKHLVVSCNTPLAVGDVFHGYITRTKPWDTFRGGPCSIFIDEQQRSACVLGRAMSQSLCFDVHTWIGSADYVIFATQVHCWIKAVSTTKRPTHPKVYKSKCGFVQTAMCCGCGQKQNGSARHNWEHTCI